jgi:hypothetical protein
LSDCAGEHTEGDVVENRLDDIEQANVGHATIRARLREQHRRHDASINRRHCVYFALAFVAAFALVVAGHVVLRTSGIAL